MTRPYARIYYDQLADEFPDVWNDPTLGWTWLRLLVVAEKMWPTTPEIPRFVKPRSVARLAELGIITLRPPHGFRVRGLDAERSRRQDSARNAARNRWGTAPGNAGGSADAMPRRDEPSQDETKIPPPPAKRGRRSDGTNPRANGTAPRQAGQSPRDLGDSPRQERDRHKRGGLDSLASILARAAAAGRPETT